MAELKTMRRWLVEDFPADVAGMARCFHCGALLYDPDAPPASCDLSKLDVNIYPLCPVRINASGTQRRNNLRAVCHHCLPKVRKN